MPLQMCGCTDAFAARGCDQLFKLARLQGRVRGRGFYNTDGKFEKQLRDHATGDFRSLNLPPPLLGGTARRFGLPRNRASAPGCAVFQMLARCAACAERQSTLAIAPTATSTRT